MEEKQADFYQKIRKQVQNWINQKTAKDSRWSEFILLAPDLFHLLCKLSVEPAVPSQKKVKLGAAIAYFISPIDFIPEAFFGPVGYLDDIAIAAYVLDDIINNVDAQIVTQHWSGDREILNLVKTILINSNRMLGSGLWKKIKRRF